MLALFHLTLSSFFFLLQLLLCLALFFTEILFSASTLYLFQSLRAFFLNCSFRAIDYTTLLVTIALTLSAPPPHTHTHTTTKLISGFPLHLTFFYRYFASPLQWERQEPFGGCIPTHTHTYIHMEMPRLSVKRHKNTFMEEKFSETIGPSVVWKREHTRESRRIFTSSPSLLSPTLIVLLSLLLLSLSPQTHTHTHTHMHRQTPLSHRSR